MSQKKQTNKNKTKPRVLLAIEKLEQMVAADTELQLAILKHQLAAQKRRYVR